jgi:hypothetical protein
VSLQHQRSGSTSAILRIRLEHANPTPRLNGVDEQVGKSNYFIGNERSRWISNIPTYGRVKYSGIYPGVDLVYYGSQRQLEYDFVLAPESDPDRIELRFAGAKRLRVDQDGNLVVQMAGGEAIEHTPVIYQEIGGRRRPVAGGYVLKSKDKVGFKLASYDRDNAVTIDPSLAYSTYLGGSSGDGGEGIVVDSSGNAYVTGFTESVEFPTTSGALRTTFGGGNSDAFVTKLSSTGSATVYSTYLGGSNFDEGLGVAVDSSGNAYVTGITNSSDFPTTAGSLQTTLRGGDDAFVSKLNSTGSALVYSTYLGGSSFENGVGVAVDSSGNAYVTGATGPSDFPTTPDALQTSFGDGPGPFGDSDAFVSTLDSTGSALVYSTYLGGSSFDQGRGVAVNSSGNAYIIGQTLSIDFPTTAGALQTTFGGSADAFVSKISTVNTLNNFVSFVPVPSSFTTESPAGLSFRIRWNIQVFCDTDEYYKCHPSCESGRHGRGTQSRQSTAECRRRTCRSRCQTKPSQSGWLCQWIPTLERVC